MSSAGWRYIDDSPAGGMLNMATDLALLTSCNEGIAPPTLRLYGWEQPTLSVGYSQTGKEAIDLNRCRQQQVSIVRRPTGGRILLHHKELTYSIVAPIDYPIFPNGLRKTNKIISQALVDCLNQLDLKGPAFVHLKPHSAPRYRQSKACFALPNRFEVMVGGKKIMGSAQRRLKKAFLQHGSIMLHFDPESFNRLLSFPNQEARESHLSQLKYTASDLWTFCRKPISFSSLKQVFFQNLSQAFAKEAVFGKLTDYEKKLRDRFCRECFNLSQ